MKYPRYGRYMKIQPSPAYSHPGKHEISLSTDGHQWSCMNLSRHELIKLNKLITKYLKDENLRNM